MEIEHIDQKLGIEETVTETDVVFRNVLETNAKLFGFHGHDIECGFLRMPEDVSIQINEAVFNLSRHTAGGRCRFLTDSAYVAIRVNQRYHRKNVMSHMTFLGSTGFDLYLRLDSEYIFGGSLIPSTNRQGGYEAIVRFPDRKLRDVTLNFPLYDKVWGLELGLQSDAILSEPPAYTIEKPVLFYGSSITQGACASRPGLCYEAILSRRLDFDYRNFGLSGRAMGEPEIANYLSQIEASAIVLDYDHNAPDALHLEKTHRQFYEILRKSNPDMPILIVTSPGCPVWENEQLERLQCRDVIRQTYEKAKNAGDENVYWLEGWEFFPKFGALDCTVDGTHPNDLGFWCMANAMEPILRTMLKNDRNAQI